MIDIIGGGSSFRLLTPQIAKDYLLFKKEYEGKDFLSIRNQIIPIFFSEEEFCKEINTLRSKRIELSKNTSKMDKHKREKMFDDAYDSVLWNKIKNKNIDQEEFRKLIGTLMNVFRTKKFMELTQNYTRNIAQVLDIIRTEQRKKDQKRKEKLEKAQNKIIENEMKLEEYESEILMIMDDLIYEFFKNKELGNSISEDEIKGFGKQTWNIFLNKHKKDINKKMISKLNNYLHEKNIL